MRREILLGAMRDLLTREPDDHFDSCVTDPPYALTAETGQTFPGRYEANQRCSAGGFMGLAWDAALPAVEDWREVFRVLKPGAHLVAFGGTRTYHRLASLIETAGFEIRDQLAWVYWSGFPKSLDVSKAIDKAAGAVRPAVRPATGRARQGEGGYAFGEAYDVTAPATPEASAWAGWGTALKPCWEPIVLARKPFRGTVAASVLARGTGAINVDGARIPFADGEDMAAAAAAAAAAAQRLCRDQNENRRAFGRFENGAGSLAPYLDRLESGRWPPNVIAAPGCFGEDTRCVDLGAWFAAQEPRYNQRDPLHRGVLSGLWPVPKPDAAEREAGLREAKTGDRQDASWNTDNPYTMGGAKARLNVHPTVKPVALMRYLIRLVTRRGGVVLEPFAGSGTTCVAAVQEACGYVACEREAQYVEIARARSAHATHEWDGVPLAPTAAPLPLFDGGAT